ncbi:hypothetical protein EI94DRAFT_1757233 [Lactarius quietus]|nr:hypothetical protein EI94DRAFT_1757233 [Lactarius quietus]
MAIGKAAKWISFANPHQNTAPSPQTTLDPTLAIADEKQFGLENFGNTCYANSVLQALYFCAPFRDLVIQSTDISAPPIPVPRPTHPPTPATTAAAPRRKYERGRANPDQLSAPTTPSPVIPSTPPTLFSALRSLYVYISKNPADKGALAPRAFIDKLRDCNELFRGAMHQDAHEFLNYLLNKIVEEIQYDKHHKGVSPSNDSGEDLSSSVATLISNNAPAFTVHSETSQQSGTLVHRLFEGTLTSETRCLTCETVSSRDESFLDLSIDIEQNSSVTACLRQFSASEMLCQRNKFFCDSCCGLQEAEKRMKIKKLPNVLALHLKRFKYQEDLRKYIKLTYRVAFPFELRLFNTVDEVDDPDRLYELFGIVVHIGSGPHHGHYVAIVKGPHSWLMFDDDKIEPIKESEIPRYFGDAASGSAYVLYYQAVDLDLASVGLKPPTPPVVPDVVVEGVPVCGTKPEANGGAAPDLLEPALPPGLGDSHIPTPASAPAPAVTPAPPPPPIPSAPSSPSLVSPPLIPSESLPIPTRKKSLPVIRIPGTSDSTTISPTTPVRTHGGLFHSLRSSPGSSKIRPTTSEGIVAPRSPGPDTPPVPPVPSLYVNGKELAAEKGNEKEKEKEGGVDKEREPQREKEEARSSKEFDRKPSLWFKRWSAKSPKDERDKEKDKDKAKEKDSGTPPVPAIAATSSQATTSSSAVALSSVPSQSDGGSSASGASSIWRRGSARLGHHTKHGSATFSGVSLGEFAAASPPPVPGSAASSHPLPRHHHPHPPPPPPPPPLPAVPQTPQTLQVTLPEADSPSPSTSASGSHSPGPTAPAYDPLASTPDELLPPSASDPSDDEDNDDEDHKDNGHADADADGHADGHHKPRHRWALPRTPAALLSGLQRGRPHSMHGSGNGTPREGSVSPQAQVEPSPQSAPAADGQSDAAVLTPLANGAPSSSLSSSSSASARKGKDKDKELAGFRRATRKLSLNAPMFGLGLGLGLGGREKDRERERERDVGKKDDGKKLHKMRTPGTALGSSSAAVASAAQ